MLVIVYYDYNDKSLLDNIWHLFEKMSTPACFKSIPICFVFVENYYRLLLWVVHERRSVWSNRGQLYGSKDEEACGRIEDSCMVQNSFRLYQVMSRLLFRIVIDTCKTYLFVNRKYNIISITGLFHVLILVPFFVESLVELRTKCIQLQIRIVSRFYNQDII